MEKRQIMYSIEEEVFNKCTNFAIDSVDSSLDCYAKRNQTNKSKIITDIRNGKIAEEITYSLLSEQLFNLSKPDYAIYSAYQKSWAPDLNNQDYNISVKSQTKSSGDMFGTSWIFSKKDDVLYTHSSADYAALVVLDIDRRMAFLKSIMSITSIREQNLFKPLKNATLNSSKVAVYMSDISQLPSCKLWQTLLISKG